MVAFAGVLAPLAADLERGKRVGMADPPGGHLIDRDAGAEVGTVGLPRVAAGEKAGHGAGVIAAAVAVCPRRVQGQTAQDEQVVLEACSGSRIAGSSKSGASRSRRPVGHVDAVGDIEERHAQRRALPIGRCGDADRPRPHRFQQGNATERPGLSGRSVAIIACGLTHRIPSVDSAGSRNGSLSTTARTRAENR